MNIQFTPDDIRRGCILLDSEKGKELGLTSDRFEEGSYLWLKDKTLYLSMLISKKEHQGYVLDILNKAQKKGYDMECVPISRRMIDILMKFGFRPNQSGVWRYENSNN